MEKDKIKKLLIKISVSAVLFVILLWKVDEHAIIEKLKSMDFRFAPIIILFIVLNYVVSSIRWKRLIIFPNAERSSLGYLITLYFTGSFFNNFMPTSVGGDVYKVLKLGKKIDSKTNAFTATFMERFLGVLALCIISSASFAKLLGWRSLLLVVGGLVLTFVGIKFVGVLSKKYEKVRNVVDSLLKYKRHKDVLVFAFVYSFLVQLCAIFAQYFVFVSLGYHIPIVYSMFVLPLIILAGFFIPSLNGIGVQDALYVSMFSVVGVPSEAALTASILYHILRLLVSLFGGLLYAIGLDE